MPPYCELLVLGTNLQSKKKLKQKSLNSSNNCYIFSYYEKIDYHLKNISFIKIVDGIACPDYSKFDQAYIDVEECLLVLLDFKTETRTDGKVFVYLTILKIHPRAIEHTDWL